MSDHQGILRKAVSIIHTLEDGLLFVTTSAIVFLSALQIILRNIFESGVVWVSPLLGVLVFWVGMLGALVATREHGHIKINVLSVYASDALKIILQFIANLFSCLVCLVLAYYSIKFVQLDLSSTAIAFANVPVWVTEVIMPVSFLLMGLRFLIFAFSCLVSLLKNRKVK